MPKNSLQYQKIIVNIKKNINKAKLKLRLEKQIAETQNRHFYTLPHNLVSFLYKRNIDYAY